MEVNGRRRGPPYRPVFLRYRRDKSVPPVPREALAGGERLGPEDELQRGERRVGLHVGDFLADVADTVGGRERRDLDGAQDAERLAALVEERAARVARDARRGGVHGVRPATGAVRHQRALLRTQLRDAEPELGVAVG